MPSGLDKLVGIFKGLNSIANCPIVRLSYMKAMSWYETHHKTASDLIRKNLVFCVLCQPVIMI